jgi:preprotein translocase subunit SecG
VEGEAAVMAVVVVVLLIVVFLARGDSMRLGAADTLGGGEPQIVSQRCCNSVTMVLEQCYSGVMVVLARGYRGHAYERRRMRKSDWQSQAVKQTNRRTAKRKRTECIRGMNI